MLNRVVSTLSETDEKLVAEAIGCFLAVHRELGPGMSETVYTRAAVIELCDRRIPFETEKLVAVSYKGHLLCHQRVDLLIDGRVVVEIKSVEAIHPVHVAQAVSYLRVTGCRVGLVVNFNVELLKHGIRRVVL